MSRTLILPALCATLCVGLSAQPAPAPLSAAQRRAVVASLAQALRARYIFPEVATRTADALEAKAAAGAYDGAKDTKDFAQALGKDLRDQAHDVHCRVVMAPDLKAAEDDEGAPTPQEVARTRQEMASFAFGILKVERLHGNVGYLDLRGFGPTYAVAPAYDAAMTLLSGCKAIILDLRRNGGGEPESVAYLLSHFFPEGDVRHLNDLRYRAGDRTQQYWTSPVAVHFGGPVYVLTSPRTFSGGEECAYDLQTQKRGILVGETTGGGANPGGLVPLGEGLAAFIPSGRAVNPITGTNWEHVGVKPDIAVPASDALKTAWAAIVKGEAAEAKDPEEKAYLTDLLGRIQRDDLPKPVFTRPKGL
ncbi:MAG TPA: S41 family peptidase [Holophagaceae bacterium]|nr:S41 family peptidase [Holophagaceae bacterium]